MRNYLMLFLVVVLVNVTKCDLTLQIVKSTDDVIIPVSVSNIVEERVGASFSLICELTSSSNKNKLVDDNLIWIRGDSPSNQTKQNFIASNKTPFTGLGLNKSEKRFDFLQVEDKDVSYFAAGIVAHLASDGEEQWNVTSHMRSEMLVQLENAVTQWKVPENEMVAYRSFKPFFPLLRIDMDYQVQLWAVWAIHHVCTKNPTRYCLMLKEEAGHVLLSDLENFSETHPEIKFICSQILDTLELSGV
ncbi:hypothetical protein NQ315_010893 [Exocentrus adspersus]|uniref:Protein zer-1 homolog-like C-terminal domain-containing protein n=1 Tax=Exocentrus adspersus TaxID=1586481 RepID=A0AAV8VQB0_9CUCU|nr:hypothetical protein NQ315_010893 [Exocentrus adspersus]